MDRLRQTVCPQRELSPSDLLRLMQKIAGDDAARREGGQELLLSRGCTWVLVKNRLSIRRWPAAGEPVMLTTWPLKGRFGLYPRMIEIYDGAGETLVHAESIWAIMDVESRSMLPGESRGIEMIGVEEGRTAPQRRITVPEGGVVFDLTPTAEQIDENGHMNNAAYLDAAASMLPPELAGKAPTSIAIDYEHEILPGHHAQVRVIREGEACYFEGSMEGKVCFRLCERFSV